MHLRLYGLRLYRVGAGVVAAGYKYYNCSECCKRLLTLTRVSDATERLPLVGPALRIIGFWVDPNLMRVTMDDEDRNNLLKRVQGFISTAPGGTRRTLREVQELAGWINWSFNVFPLLKPSLSNVYEKMSGKTETHAKIFVNKGVIRDLSWFVSEVRILDGVYLFEDVDWLAEDAELTAIGDAS